MQREEPQREKPPGPHTPPPPARDRFPVVAHVLLIRGERLFLLRRAGTGFMDGWHVPPGGHQQAGERVAQAALRECREETGVQPDALRPVCVMPYRSGRHQGLNFLFEATGWRGEPGIGEPASCDAAGWFPLAALPAPLAPWLPAALAARADGTWYLELAWD